MTTLLTLYAIALAYLRRGWAVIPVPYKKKRPGFSNWQHARLTEDDLIESFPDRPMNISVLVGKPSNGLADVDLDVPLAIMLSGWFLPQTGAIFGRPSSRRAHWLYLISGEAKTASWEDPTIAKDDESEERGMLLEFRFSGHTLFPGSTHPSGESVTWDEEGAPLSITSAELLPRLNRLAAAVLLARHWPRQGSRHQAALALAGGLLRAGWTVDEIVDFVRAVTTGAGDEEVEDRCQAVVTSAEALQTGRPTTGWPRLTELIDSRVVRAVTSWLAIAASEPPDPAASADAWSLPISLPEGPRPPFPVEDLPPTLRLFVASLAVATQTPPALAALLVFAVLAASAAKRVVVLIRSRWKEPVNLFIAVALGPANRKSSVFSDCAEPLEDFERDEIARLTPEIGHQLSALKIKRKELEALERKAATVDDRISAEEKTQAAERAAVLARELAATLPPELPRLIVDDCSPEKLATHMSVQGGRIAALSPEGGVFGMMAGRYSTNSQPNLDVYLKGHAGDDLRVDRVGRPPDFVRQPALTIGLAVQPGVIRQLAEKPEFRERGLPARFIYGMPASLVGSRRIGAPGLPDDVRERYHHCVRSVLELPRFINAKGESYSRDLVLSPEADQVFRAFEERLEPRLGEYGDLGHIADWAGKLAGATARIAGLLHVSEYASSKVPWDIPIAEQTMAAAIHLAETFIIPHALTAFAAMGADPALEAARKLLGWIERSRVRVFNIRDAHQDLRKHGLSPGQLERAAQVLVEHHYLRPVMEPPKSGAGRPSSPQFEVNPRWSAHNPHNPQTSHNESTSENFEDFVHSEDGFTPNTDGPLTNHSEDDEERARPSSAEDVFSRAYDEVVFQ